MDFDFVAATLEKYGLAHLDAKKVLLKMGGRRPGKHCVGKAGGKGSYISAEKKCASHKGADGKLTAAGANSARELAVKVRARKGMQDDRDVTLARMPLKDFIGEQKNSKTAKQLVPMMTKIHGEARSELNKRRINGGRSAIVDKKATKAKPDRPEPFSLGLHDLDKAYGPELDQFAAQAKAHPRYKTIQKVLDKMEKADQAKHGESRPVDPVTALTGTYNPKDYLGYEYREYDRPFMSPGTRKSKKVKAMTEKDVEAFNSATSAINKKLGFEATPSAWDIAEKFTKRSDSTTQTAKVRRINR